MKRTSFFFFLNRKYMFIDIVIFLNQKRKEKKSLTYYVHNMMVFYWDYNTPMDYMNIEV